MQFASLTDLITTLLDGSRLSFSVEAPSKIFSTKETHLPTRFFIHSTPFCTAAKTTMKGHQTCLNCKQLCRKKIMKEQKSFLGACPYGIMEYVHPVFSDGNLMYSLYIGNMVMDRQETEERIRRRCHKTGVSPEKLIAHLDRCETNADLEKVKKIALITESYLSLLSDKVDFSAQDDTHWAVHELKQIVDVYYGEQLTLAACAEKLFINEKYIGRIFKEQVGVTFHEYLNSVRLRRAKNLLWDTSLSISAISYECGFSNISYLNRLFKKKYGVSPGEYRKNKSSILRY